MHNLYHKIEETAVVTKILAIFGRTETPGQKLWREVYVARIASGSNHKTAAENADWAVQAFNERRL